MGGKKHEYNVNKEKLFQDLKSYARILTILTQSLMMIYLSVQFYIGKLVTFFI